MMSALKEVILAVIALCPLQDLYEEFDALLLCTGATWPRDLPIYGRQLEGIYFAMTFLESWQKKQMGNAVDQPHLSAKDKDVIIIGGGDTGCDCIATSLRQVNSLIFHSGCTLMSQYSHRVSWVLNVGE